MPSAQCVGAAVWDSPGQPPRHKALLAGLPWKVGTFPPHLLRKAPWGAGRRGRARRGQAAGPALQGFGCLHRPQRLWDDVLSLGPGLPNPPPCWFVHEEPEPVRLQPPHGCHDLTGPHGPHLEGSNYRPVSYVRVVRSSRRRSEAVPGQPHGVVVPSPQQGSGGGLPRS